MSDSKILRSVYALLLLMHGIAHMASVAFYWKIAEIEALGPYKTTVLDGSADIGDGGAIVLGFIWLFAGIGFAIVSYGLLQELNWWRGLVLLVALVSLVLCAINWELLALGAMINLAIIAVLLLERGFAQRDADYPDRRATEY